MLDRDGYRPNVGIILCNGRNEVFWGKRIKEHSWQFPQGGIKLGETPVQAMYRELQEEVGLLPSHVKILGRTRNWLRYEVPVQWLKRDNRFQAGGLPTRALGACPLSVSGPGPQASSSGNRIALTACRCGH